MQVKRLQMLLMCSAFITLAYSFPTATKQNTSSKNESSVSDKKENKRPLVLIMEEKTPKSDSVVVQFVYTSNSGSSKVQSAGTDKDKYVVDSPVKAGKTDQKMNSSAKEKTKSNQILNTDAAANEQNSKPKIDATKIPVREVTSLMPEEASPLTGKWPKYFYDAFNPIQPFPELQDGRSNQIISDKLNENADTYIPYNMKERREPSYVSGPQLNPLSIYDREFNVPIFD